MSLHQHSMSLHQHSMSLHQHSRQRSLLLGLRRGRLCSVSRQLVGTDYHGNDMIKGGLSATSASEYVSPTQKTSATTRFCLLRGLIVIVVVVCVFVCSCCWKCAVTAGCKFWTYGSANPMINMCWVKTSSSGKESQSNRIAGSL